MADAEKSLLFVIKANIEDYNHKVGEARRNFQQLAGNIQKECEDMGNKFLFVGGAIAGIFTASIIKAAEKSPELKEKIDTIKGKFDELYAAIANNSGIVNLITDFTNLLTKATDWIDKHEDLVKAFLAIGVAIAGVGAALKIVALSMALVKAVSGLGGAAQVLAGLGALGLGMYVFNELNKAPAAGTKGTKITPAKSDVTSEWKTVPAAAAGGIFPRPQLAMIGEAGPEAVIPLNNLGSMTGLGGGPVTQHFHFAGFIADDTALRQFARQLEKIQSEETRRHTFKLSQTQTYGPNHL